MESFLSLICLLTIWSSLQILKLGPVAVEADSGNAGVQPLSKIAIHRALFALHENASVKAYPFVLGQKVILIGFWNFFCRQICIRCFGCWEQILVWLNNFIGFSSLFFWLRKESCFWISCPFISYMESFV